MSIAVWADYSWIDLDEEEIEEYSHKSDDYMVLDVPDDVEDVDVWLAETKPQG